MFRRLERRSAWILVGVALVVAIALPTTGAGGISLLIVVGALGVAVVDHGARIPRAVTKPSRPVARAIAIGVVVVGAAAVFGRVLHDAIGWTMGDWGIQHAVMKSVIHGLHEHHLPVWSHALSTGDAPLETYPAMTYLIGSALAIVTGSEDRLPVFLLCFGIVVHTLIAIGITRLCLRVAPAPIAAVAGLTQLIDAGGISAGGVAGNLEWALVHNALSQAFALFAVMAVIAAIERPRLRTTLAIWVWTALAAATHPSALLFLGAVMVALVGASVLATDVPARRPLVAAGHVALGLALAAAVWMPLGERLVLYGQHFPSPPRTPPELLRGLLSWPAPATSFAPVMYLGYLGLVAGIVSRRAVPVLIGFSGVLLLLGLVDTPYLLLDAAPSQALARLGAERFHALCRPFVVAGAAYALAIGLRAAARRWRGTTELARKRVLAAVIAIGALLVVRGAVPYIADRAAESAAAAERTVDDDGRTALEAWARQQMAALPPDRYARALFDIGDVHYNYHLTAETGMPGFHMGATPNLLLRERIEDLSPASLRRFDVRWVIIADDTDAPARTDLEDWERPNPKYTAATLALGDPATEQRFGRYVVREVPDWDGAFARIERGGAGGGVRVVSLTDERVEVELTGTDQPALVALGIGFYPRWRAHDASGKSVPVYALPSIDGGQLHVVSAWVRPGKTVFTVDGSLPSDTKGRGLAILAGGVMIAMLVIWARRRSRARILRRMARVLQWVRGRRRRVTAVAVLAVAVLLPIAGVMRACRPAANVEVGVGLRGAATVSARTFDGSYEECGYSRLDGRYTCPGIAAVSDSVSNVVNDAQANWPRHQGTWPFVTPAIFVQPLSTEPVEVRIETSARLDGTYWLGAEGGAASVTVGTDAPIALDGQREVTFDGRGNVDVTIDASASTDGTWVAFLRKDTVEPDRPFLVAPPETPPPP